MRNCVTGEKNAAEPHWVSVHKLTFNYSAEVIIRTCLEASINVSSPRSRFRVRSASIQYLEEPSVANLVQKPPKINIYRLFYRAQRLTTALFIHHNAPHWSGLDQNK